MSTKVYREARLKVSKIIEGEEGEQFTELDYAAHSRLALLYIMVHMRQLICVAKGIRFCLVVITIILAFLFGWVIRINIL